MEEHTFKVLEFHELKKQIACFSSFEKGRNLILNMEPLESYEEARVRQNKIQQFLDFYYNECSYNLRGLKVIDFILNRAKVGASLSGVELIELLENFIITRNLKKYFHPYQERYRLIWEEISRLEVFEKIETQIKNALSPEGFIKDTASAEISRIRKKIKIIKAKIQKSLENLIKDPNMIKMLQEPVITIRQDRFVLPVRSEYRRKFFGHVVDASSTGMTVFMEPSSTLNFGNDLKSALFEEKKEEERILAQLSYLIKEVLDKVIRNQEILAALDFYFSITSWAEKYNCFLPELNKERYIYLKGARHPLLNVEKIVPIDISVGEEFTSLILTGPNTGGKTVALKTIGLLTVMAACGIPIPAEDSTSISFFSGIFADIGDEQSIFQNLSTFSSHLNNIIRIISRADESSLVLLDEIGAGTDPAEGSAIAMAILDYFYKKGITVIASTHFNDLKKFASSHEGFKNAAVEFDPETLKPKYSIIMGVPGKSCAFQVAASLGLRSDILEEAKSKMDFKEFEVDKLLEELASKSHALSKEKEKNMEERTALDKLAENYKIELENFKTSKESFRQERKNKLKEIVDYYKQVCERIYEDFKSSKKKIAKEVEQLAVKSEIFQAQAELTAKFKEAGKKFDELRSNLEEKALPLDFNEVLKKIKSDKESISYEIPDSFKTEINIRGKTTDEAVYELEKYIDRCILLNIKKFYVIHGKGKGILRKVIWEYLKEQDFVKSYRLGSIDEGSFGVTRVELK